MQKRVVDQWDHLDCEVTQLLACMGIHLRGLRHIGVVVANSTAIKYSKSKVLLENEAASLSCSATMLDLHRCTQLG